MILGHAKAGNLAEARRLFVSVGDCTSVTWTIMIALADADLSGEAFALFREMVDAGVVSDRVAITAVLGACQGLDALSWVRQVHADIIKLGFKATLSVSNTLTNSYCKCGLLDMGRPHFDEMPEKDSVTYSAIVMGYSKEGFHSVALELFMVMQDPNLKPSQFTFSGALSSATGLGDLGLGQRVHGHVIKANFEWNVCVNNSLLDVYSKCDCLDDLRGLFDKMPERDNVSYKVVISGNAWNRCMKGSLELLREMHLIGFDRQELPCASLLSVSGALPQFQMGRQLHALVIITGASSDDLVGNAVIDMYSKCGIIDMAEMIFTSKADRNTVLWTTMISGNVHSGHYEEVLKVFFEMRLAGLIPDRATLFSILNASSSLAMIGLGQQLHCYLIRSGYKSNLFSRSALLDMYAKCGCLKETAP